MLPSPAGVNAASTGSPPLSATVTRFTPLTSLAVPRTTTLLPNTRALGPGASTATTGPGVSPSVNLTVAPPGAPTLNPPVGAASLSTIVFPEAPSCAPAKIRIGKLFAPSSSSAQLKTTGPSGRA